jgi:hypothetical protein
MRKLLKIRQYNLKVIEKYSKYFLGADGGHSKGGQGLKRVMVPQKKKIPDSGIPSRHAIHESLSKLS